MPRATVHAFGRTGSNLEHPIVADAALRDRGQPTAGLMALSEPRHDQDVVTAEPSTAAFLSRFIVLQAIGAACVAALWIAGLANKPFESRSAPVCWIILLVGAIGLACVLLQRWRDAQWIAKHVVRIGLLGTVIGLIIAFSAATHTGAASPADIKPLIASVVSGMYVSLYATLMGIGTNLWLKINLRLLGNVHG